MNNNMLISKNAAVWALSKVGCSYSQAKRTQATIFDCSSLVARAYSAQGKQWFYGGDFPLSNQEVYDDEFELLWPETYSAIGKALGADSVIAKATQCGDLQFLCTDSKTKRSNRITHVAMVSSATEIVHARGTAYGVCTSPIKHYSGKVCAISRYNPECSLRIGMKGYRTLALQTKLNEQGATLTVDGEFGNQTVKAVKDWQVNHGLPASGIADGATLTILKLIQDTEGHKEAIYVAKDSGGLRIRINGNTVNIRTGPSTDYPAVGIAKLGELYEAADIEHWQPIHLDDKILWINRKYTEEA